MLVTTNVYLTLSPAARPLDLWADFCSRIAGWAPTGVRVLVGGDVTGGAAPGGLPLAVAVFDTLPELRSAWVSRYLAVHVVDLPGSSVVTGHVAAETRESRTLIP